MAKRSRTPKTVPAPPAPPTKPATRISHAALGAAAATGSARQITPWSIPRPPPGVAPAEAAMAMDECVGDLYAYAGANYGVATGYGVGLHFLGYPYLAELLQKSEYRRMVGVLAQEMTRKWCRITSTGEDDNTERVTLLGEAMKRFRVREVFREAAEHDGAFGIGHIYLDTGSGDNPNELKTPLIADRAKVKKGGLKRIKVIEPLWAYPSGYESSDPLSPHFYRPQFWYVNSRQIHHSRFLTLVSREVPDILKPAFLFGGISLTQLAIPTVENWLRTRTSVSELLHSFTVWQLKTNMQATIAGGSGDELASRAQLFTLYRDNSGLMMTDKESEDITNVSVPLGTLDHLQAQSQEQQAAVDGMPLIKLVGYTPSGLNSTGEGEMDAWRDRVRAQQEHLFNDPLKRVMDMIQLSEFGDIDDSISFEWESLEEADETARAAIRKSDADVAIEYIGAGVLAPEEERTRLAAAEDSLYPGLDVADVPELPEADTGELDDSIEAAARLAHAA